MWIIGLAGVALGSLDGTLSDYLISSRLFGNGVTQTVYTSGSGDFGAATSSTSNPLPQLPCTSGDQILRITSLTQENYPPVGVILYAIVPNWQDASMIKASCATVDDYYSVQSVYERLFDRVAERLRSIARSDNVDPKSFIIDVNFFPQQLRPKPQPEAAAPTDTRATSASVDIRALPEVQDWIADQKTRIKEKAQAKSLASTFLLLSVLGAFGALIFLIRDYIVSREEKIIAEYVFRPILGVFLAIAAFVVVVLAHSVISTANILEIRYTPLYVLALGAGLLSETAYGWLSQRAQGAFTDQNQHRGAGAYEAEPEADPKVDEPVKA
jgi:hypothetical protein